MVIFSQMHELGIQSRLDQVFDAPNAVKDVLISQANLDKSVCPHYGFSFLRSIRRNLLLTCALCQVNPKQLFV